MPGLAFSGRRPRHPLHGLRGEAAVVLVEAINRIVDVEEDT
jgi:hypothetical protein